MNQKEKNASQMGGGHKTPFNVTVTHPTHFRYDFKIPVKSQMI